ncbi:MAG: hypothetical protein WBC91_15005 [Phototrophicaceae bacterium]
MFEIIAISIGIILVILLIPFLLWRFMIGGMLRSALTSFFNSMNNRGSRIDLEDHRTPEQLEPISTVMEDYAQAVKQQTPLPLSPNPRAGTPHAPIATAPSTTKLFQQPPYQQNPVTIEATTQGIPEIDTNDAIKQAPQPLVDNHTFAVDDPIIDARYIDPSTPSADTLDANIPIADSSPYGVRSADHSPGRRLRDKRYRRNSS